MLVDVALGETCRSRWDAQKNMPYMRMTHRIIVCAWAGCTADPEVLASFDISLTFFDCILSHSGHVQMKYATYHSRAVVDVVAHACQVIPCNSMKFLGCLPWCFQEKQC